MSAAENKDDAPPLSDAEVESLEVVIQSAPPTSTRVSTSSQLLATIFSIGLQAVFKQPNTPSDIIAALDDMVIPEEDRLKLQPLFADIGFELKNSSVSDPGNRLKSRTYTTARGKGIEIAILHLQSWVLRTTDSTLIVAGITRMFRNRPGRIVSKGVERAMIGFRQTLESVSTRDDQSWRFVPWGDVEEALNGQQPVDTAFAILLPEDVITPKDNFELMLPRFAQETIIDMFRTKAKERAFFEGVVAEADWSDELKEDMKKELIGDPKLVSWQVLRLLLSWNRYGAPPEKVNDTYLGWVLLRLLKNLGDPLGKEIAGIIIDQRLLSREEELKAARERFKAGG